MKTVRRNITMNEFAAKNMEKASDFTGRSQSDLLESALNQPIMRRLWAFTNTKRNPVVELLEVYQAEEGHMTPRIGERILDCIKDWVGDKAVVDKKSLSRRIEYVNEYIAGHMTDGSMEACPYFKTVWNEAQEGIFLTGEMDPEAIREKVIAYIDAVMSGPSDSRRMGESYLFRNLLVILDNCFSIPKKEEIYSMYHDLSDGYVLPYDN